MMLKASSYLQRNDDFWLNISEKIRHYNQSISASIAETLGEIGVVKYESNTLRIDIDSDIFMSSYPIFETS